MNKVIYSRYGDERVLEWAGQPIPAVQDDQLLIRVKAASINPLDWKLYRGEMKMMSGAKFPKSVGIDFSGIVEKAGKSVTRFREGDVVFGLTDVFKGGALAEYVVVAETAVALKPGNVSFEQAAALPVTGLAALQIVDRLAGIGEGQEVLINGAAGGIGMFAVQIAKKRGAKVTAVAGAKGAMLAAAWGADVVLDYARQDVRQLSSRFDVVIDLSDKLPFRAARKLMKRKATYISTLPSPLALLSSFLHNLFSAQKSRILMLKPDTDGLGELAGLANDGLEIRLEKVYSATDVREAYRETSAGITRGKSVIRLD